MEMTQESASWITTPGHPGGARDRIGIGNKSEDDEQEARLHKAPHRPACSCQTGHPTPPRCWRRPNCVCFLRILKQKTLPFLSTSDSPTTAAPESILTSVCGSTAAPQPTGELQQVVATAERPIGVQLPKLEDIYHSHCVRKAGTTVYIKTPHTHSTKPLNCCHPVDAAYFIWLHISSHPSWSGSTTLCGWNNHPFLYWLFCVMIVSIFLIR